MLTGNPFFDEKSGQFKLFITEDDTTTGIRDEDLIGQPILSIPKKGKPRDKTIAVVEWRDTTKKNVKGIIVLCTEDMNGEPSTQSSSSESTSSPNGGDFTLLIEKLNRIEELVEKLPYIEALCQKAANLEGLCEQILDKMNEEEIPYAE